MDGCSEILGAVDPLGLRLGEALLLGAAEGLFETVGDPVGPVGLLLTLGASLGALLILGWLLTLGTMDGCLLVVGAALSVGALEACIDGFELTEGGGVAGDGLVEVDGELEVDGIGVGAEVRD